MKIITKPYLCRFQHFLDFLIQIKELDLKGLCIEEQVFQYEDFSCGMDTEETFNQSSLKFDEKDLGQTQDSAKTYTSEEELSLDNAKANMNLEFSNDQLKFHLLSILRKMRKNGFKKKSIN